MTYTSILVDPSKILNIHQGALRKGVLLGCIFQNIAGKNEKMCPTANFISRRVLNLPYLRITNVEDKKRVVKVLQEIIDLK